MEQMKLGNQIEQGIAGLNLQNAGLYGADGKKTDAYMTSGAAKDVMGSGAFSVEHGSTKQDSSLTGNFEEYLKEKQARAKEEGEDAATKERQAEEEARELAQNISAEEMAMLRQMGVDVSSASLDDVMGMLNTMRGNAHRADMQQLLARVAAGNEVPEDLVVAGGTVKLPGSGIEVENLSVSDVVAKEDSFKPTDDDFVYLLRNQLEFSAENLYKAHYSGNRLQQGKDMEILSDMEEQMQGVAEQAGIPKAEGVELAKLLFENDVPVTAENLRSLQIYRKFEDTPANAVTEEMTKAVRAELDYPTPEKAQELYENVQNIAPEMVFDMTVQGHRTTIAAALAYMDEQGYGNISDYYKENAAHVREVRSLAAQTDPTNSDIQAVSAMRRMEEIRLSMTVQVSYRMLKNDIHIDTRELSKVVAELERTEQQLTKEAFARAGVEMTDENKGIYDELQQAVSDIADAPAEILGSPLKGTAFTVRALYAEAQSVVSRVNISDENAEGGVQEARAVRAETVRLSYEAVGTAPRADMGDSIKKAFANVEDILKEMALPQDEAHQRAVRILGYNSIEITEANITQVMHYDRQVNDLVSTFYPEAVLGMIKDGINPMDVPIDELNAAVRERNYNAGVTEADNFATYLVDMERQGAVSAEERESYIGIYRVMNRLAKSGDREAGWLFANGSRLTVRNLINAMRSREARGLNAGVDDEFGMLTNSTVSGKRMDVQIETAFSGTNEQPQNSAEDELAKEYARVMENMTEETRSLLKTANLPVSEVNLLAADALSNGEIYNMIKTIAAKLAGAQEREESTIVDEEIAVMTGEGGTLDVSERTLLEHLTSAGEMSLTYSDLGDELTEMMYRGGITGSFTGRDLAAVKTVQAGFRLMGSLASRGHFRIPVDSEEGTKIMNLTIQQLGERRGDIEIGIRGDEMGYVKAQLHIGQDGAASGSVVAETAEGNAKLAEVRETFVAALNEENIRLAAVTFGTVSNPEAAPGGDLNVSYRAARKFVEVLGNILY